jgi:Zn-dependent protease with chaperone function
MLGFRFLEARRLALGLVLALGAASGCAREQSQPVYYGQPQYGQPGAPGGAIPGQPVAGQAPGAVATVAPAPTFQPVSASDPVNNHDILFLRARAQQVLNDLVAALPPQQQARVNGIPLVVDATPGEVNAFASCSGSRSAMAISDGLLQIESQLARFRAYDELAGTNKVGEYIGVIARGARPKQPLPDVPAGFADPRFDLDPRKVTRQYQLLDEQIAFVMGHELGHHYLGHLPCTASGGLSLSELGAVLSNAVPAFNQPNELAADMVGINNTLTMGSRRTDYRLTEGGALLTMQFFAGLDQLTPADILFGFERSHPPPAVRTPIIQQTAATWRATGGVGLPIFSL